MMAMGRNDAIGFSLRALISLNFDLIAECFLLVSTAKQVFSWQKPGTGPAPNLPYFEAVNCCRPPNWVFGAVFETLIFRRIRGENTNRANLEALVV